MARPRFMLITYPAMGHINPTLQFAKRLAAATEADITFAIQLSAYRHMSKGSDEAMKDIETANGSLISFAPFSVDGFDDTFGMGSQKTVQNLISETARCGTQAITDLVVSARDDGRPYSLLVYTLLLPWAGVTADKLRLPSAMLWIQPAMVFAIYYHYFYGSGDIIRELCAKGDYNSSKTTLPGLSLELTRRDLPSIMDPEDTYYVALRSFEEEFEMIETRNQRRILVNSFDKLETEALRAVPGLSLIGVGPLIPLVFLDDKSPFENKSKDKYIDWLNSKPKATVVYVSFGTLWLPPKQQLEEIAKGLLDFGRPFLWVIRERTQNDEKGDDDGELSCREELDKLGMIVPWSSQVEVLCNESIGCFVSHCGWNSTLETLASGVPVVAIPRRSDQWTSAKLIGDVWKTGVRVKSNKNEIVPSDEIKRCLELVMGENGEENGVEIRRNAKKWKDLAREAPKEGGSSDKNIKALVAEMIQGTQV
ncbi:phloretin 4'-O-glucosyltransferase-like [Humulus lupulus]|uniref:phloretin 4'-O-glucosyltransferase-like n=1 Tax=Humulus lupulus TaxID=3486 RepID=UPI002B41725A|nr:phloretin 4'-O-glucosyltransferase-like [Humulus lupulus]